MDLTDATWTQTREALAAFFRRRLRDQHLAEDLMQETLLRVHDGLGGLAHRERLGAWVSRIARRVLADHLRRAREMRSLSPDDALALGPGEENYNAEVEGWLRQMISALPAEYREAVELAEVMGLPQREVADRLGLSYSGARSRVQRGRERLKALLLACCHLERDRRGNIVDHRRRAKGPCCAPPSTASRGTTFPEPPCSFAVSLPDRP